ncbi:MAG: T9SS type A sorting domain-containing protein [Armatimonadetes bacterium]|nr:T9SS type A sorting domain-containing protein [Armatimonadota bacterium]
MKTILMFILIFLAIFLRANPIELLFISEIFLENNDWTVELSNTENGYPIYYNSYELKIVTSSSEAYINRDVFLIYGTTDLITQIDLDSILIIDHTGDFIRLSDEYGSLDEKIFGNYSGSYVNPLYPGQSYVCDINAEFAPVKENFPSLGDDPFHTDARGTYSGYVYDSNMQPLADADIHYYLQTPTYYSQIVTNDEGYFEDDDIFCRNYYVQVYYNGMLEASSTISIEPDSTSYEEFVLQNVSTKDELIRNRNFILSNYPNPFNPSTAITFFTAKDAQNAKVEIYNSKGQKVDELSIKNQSNAGQVFQSSITWEASNFPSGVYLYKLIVDGKEVASNKMLLLK